MDEFTLLHNLRAGDKSAIRMWYAQYSPRLLRYVFTKVSQRKDAEELCQDTFLSCLDSLPLFKGDSSLWTWMCSIARHEIADYFRKKYAKKLIHMVPFGDMVLPETFVDMHGVSEEVRVALKKLSSRDRELLLLKYIDKASVQTIAQKMGMSLKAAESALFRARKAFQLVYSQEECFT